MALAFNLATRHVNVALRQREVLVTASVVQYVQVVLNANDHQCSTRTLNLTGFAANEVAEWTEINRRHGVTTVVAASASVMSASTTAARPSGNVATIS